jgi:hypothetical protein
MQSPAPQKQKIAGRSDSSEDTEEAFDIIENIEVVTEEDKKQETEESSDSSDSTITEVKEDYKDPPKTDGGSIKKAVEALEVFAKPSASDGTSESSSSSSSSSTSTSSSSTAGSDKSGVDISSSDSSDSSRIYLDSDSESDASGTDNKKYIYNKMPSSITKSPVSNGSRATFEELHSLWEVFGQEQGFDKYQTIVPHPDLPVDGHNAVKPVKTEKKALKKNKKAVASLRVSFSGIFTVDAMIEGTIDDAGMWPYGHIHLALVDLYSTYRPKSRLDRIQLDMDKLTIKMGDADHPDVLFELAMMVRKKY